MGRVKPIETEYNGYRFRSRLEARWAVFFDAAGIPYQYEPEGFVLSDGTYYLPDFYLPWFHAYVEIKPSAMDSKDREIAIKKCERLFQKDSVVVLFCEGDPLVSQMQVFCNELDEDGGGCGWIDCDFVKGAVIKSESVIRNEISRNHWNDTFRLVRIAVGNDGDYKERQYCDSSWQYCYLVPRSMIHMHLGYCEEAKEKARQARFEHGEKGG